MGSRLEASTTPEGSEQRSATDLLWLGAAAGVCCCWLLLRRRRVSSVVLQCLSSCNRLRFPLWKLQQHQQSSSRWKIHRAAGDASSEEASETDSEIRGRASSATADYKMVLCVRQDLGMSKGKIAAQCGHATLGAYLRAERRCPIDCLKLWAANGQKKIAVRVKDEAELEQLEWEAHKKGVNAYAVQDAKW